MPPKGQMTCPACSGQGKITEDKNKYDFISRDPKTSACLICSGSGHVGNRQLLPNGKPVTSLAAATQPKRRASRGLDLPRRGITPLPQPNDADDLEPGPYPDPSPEELNRAIDAALERKPSPIAAAFSDLSISRAHPDYAAIYSILRARSRVEGTWTATNEEEYVDGLLYHINQLNKQIKELNAWLKS